MILINSQLYNLCISSVIDVVLYRVLSKTIEIFMYDSSVR